MKRMIALLLVAAMFLTAFGAFAENTLPEAEGAQNVENEAVEPEATEEEAPAAPAFSFRNGITWGMSVDEVRALEPGQIESLKEDGNVTALRYGYTDVSIFTADYLLYLFVDNKLVSAVYLFTKNWNNDQYDYLCAALTQLYGVPAEMTKEEITAEAGFYGGFDGTQIESAFGWETDGAKVRIARDSEIDIFYFDPDFSNTPVYNTSGL